jgi:hypothetical protein
MRRKKLASAALVRNEGSKMMGETKKILKKLVCAGIVILALAGIEKARAAIWYVNPGESIQAAVDNAVAGDEVHVNPGTYYEKVAMKDGVDLIGAGADITIIDANGSLHFGVVYAEDINDHTTRLVGFTLTGGGYNCDGVRVSDSKIVIQQNIIHDNGGLSGQIYAGNGIHVFNSVPIIRNNTICSNINGVYIYSSYTSSHDPANIVNNIIVGNHHGISKSIWSTVPNLRYNDVWNNFSFDYYLLSPGLHDISEDPLFADPNNNDYHLKSQAGRWDPNSLNWVQDDVTSSCIDAGYMGTPIGLEPFPNGGIINMGVYGGTVEASKSYFGEQVCETIVAGDINGDCIVNYKDFAFMALSWLRDENQ